MLLMVSNGEININKLIKVTKNINHKREIEKWKIYIIKEVQGEG